MKNSTRVLIGICFCDNRRDLSRASQRQQVLQQQYHAELASSQLKPDMVKHFLVVQRLTKLN